MSSLASGPRRPRCDVAIEPVQRARTACAAAMSQQHRAGPEAALAVAAAVVEAHAFAGRAATAASVRGREASPPSPSRTWKMPVSMRRHQAAIGDAARCSPASPRRSSSARAGRPNRSGGSRGPSMSTQYRACSATDHSGLSPTVSRVLDNQFGVACASVARRAGAHEGAALVDGRRVLRVAAAAGVASMAAGTLRSCPAACSRGARRACCPTTPCVLSDMP